ncbi:MAG: alpha/beta hydrolase [Pseudomonadota bacterium]
MTSSKLNPDLEAAFRWMPVFPYYGNKTIPIGRAMYNFGTRTKPEFGVTIEEFDLGPLRLRVFRPTAPSRGGGVLWIHGGGFIAGTTDQVQDVASRFARWLRASIVTVQYRWAPEHPFPAALDDLRNAWQWMLDADDIDSERMAILGQSGGGGLAAALVQRIHDEGGQQPVAQVLHYPMLDDRTAVDRSLDSGGYKIWNNRCNRVAWNAYLSPAKAGDDELPPYAAPGRRENLNGLPPAWVGVGTFDLFADEARKYAERLKGAGVPTEMFFAEGAPHVFEIIAPDWEVSQEFLHETARFLRGQLKAT